MADSPTGRNPTLLWTSGRQDTWLLMKADYDANPSSPATLGGQLYKKAKTIADTDPTPYGTSIMFKAWMYHATGNVTYAQRAYAHAEEGLFTRSGYTQLGGNHIREHGVEWIIGYDWIRHGLTAPQQAAYLAKLNEMVSLWGTGYLAGDSDQLCGNVLAGLAMHYATNDHNATDTTIVVNSNGGFTASAANQGNNMNAVKYLMERVGASGVWPESPEYNLNTTCFVLQGREAIKTAAPTTVSEIDLIYEPIGTGIIALVTPDLEEVPEWGDQQQPRATVTGGLAYIYMTQIAMFAGVNQSTSVGPYLMRLFTDLLANFGGLDSIPGLPIKARCLPVFNPYATVASSLTNFPKTFYAPVMGQIAMRNGWEGANDSLFWSSMREEGTAYHHAPHWFRNFQLYRKGSWGLTYPVAYGQFPPGQLSSTFADQNNSVLVHSFGSLIGGGGTAVAGDEPTGPRAPDKFKAYKRERGQKFGTDFAYHVGTMGGLVHPSPHYSDPPPVFMHEVTQSILYLQSATKQSDVIVTFDRINATDPQTLLKFSRYRTSSPPEQTLIANTLAPKQWIIHMPVAPTIGGAASSHDQTFASNSGAIEWATVRGDLAKVETLLPTSQSKKVYNDNTLGAYASTNEKKWQARVYPVSEVQWDTFLNVVSVRDTGTSVSSTLVRDTTNLVDGCLITRTGEDNVLVSFNAVQGPDLPAYPPQPTRSEEILNTVRLRNTSFQLSWTQTTNSCKAFFCDLDPNSAWEYVYDSNPSQSLTVHESGLAELTLTGLGGHTIQIIGLGVTDPEDSPPGPIVNETPGNGSTDVSLTPTLAWDSLHATSFDVYFGEASGGSQLPTSVTRVPTGNGASATWVANTGTAYEAVDDDPAGSPDEDTTFISKTESNGAHLFTFAPLSVTGTIQSVQVTTRHKRTGTSWTRTAQLRIGGTTYSSSTSTVTASSFTSVTTTWTLNPATGLPWTTSDVNTSLQQFGINCTGNTSTGDVASMTQCYLTVNYTPVGGPSLVSNDQPGKTYTPGMLTPNTVYEWKIIASNSEGTVESALNSFTTTTDPDPDEPTFPLKRRGSHKRLLKTVISP